MTSEQRMDTVRNATTSRNGAIALVIVGDDADRTPLNAVIEASRCKPRFARDGLEAREALATEPISIVLVDGDLHSLCWRELLEEVSASEASPAPKLIIVSRVVDDRLWAEVLNLGGYDLLPKPLDAKELAWVVRSALTERNGARGPVWPGDVKEGGAWSAY